jgi:hypothetical protein
MREAPYRLARRRPRGICFAAHVLRDAHGFRSIRRLHDDPIDACHGPCGHAHACSSREPTGDVATTHPPQSLSTRHGPQAAPRDHIALDPDTRGAIATFAIPKRMRLGIERSGCTRLAMPATMR